MCVLMLLPRAYEQPEWLRGGSFAPRNSSGAAHNYAPDVTDAGFSVGSVAEVLLMWQCVGMHQRLLFLWLQIKINFWTHTCICMLNVYMYIYVHVV